MIVQLVGEALGKKAIVKIPESRSCIEHVSRLQEPVINSLPHDSRLRVTEVRVGREFWFEHHVLMIHPTGTNPVRTGVILDPWRRQTEDPKQFVMAYTDFKATYFLEVLGGENHQEVTHARPKTGR